MTWDADTAAWAAFMAGVEAVDIDPDHDCPPGEDPTYGRTPRKQSAARRRAWERRTRSSHTSPMFKRPNPEERPMPDPNIMTIDLLMGPVETRAMEFARDRHGNQRYGEHPYVVHLAAVRRVLADFNINDGPVAVAAWLHDVLEDTDTSAAEVRDAFGGDVVGLVVAVTGRGRTRRECVSDAYRKIIARGHPAAVLKLADRIANVEACVATGNPKLSMYADEQRGFEAMLRRAVSGDHHLLTPMLDRLRATLNAQA